MALEAERLDAARAADEQRAAEALAQREQLAASAACERDAAATEQRATLVATLAFLTSFLSKQPPFFLLPHKRVLFGGSFFFPPRLALLF